MKSLRQFLRQPLKLLTGIILMSAAVAVLTVCVGQNAAAEKIQAQLGEMFVSIALPAENYTKEADEWLQEYAAENPDVVKTVASPGLGSAYIEELKPDVYTDHKLLTGGINGNARLQPNTDGSDYPCAMLEITLTEIGQPGRNMRLRPFPGGKYYSFVSEHSGVTVQLKGTIESIVAMAEQLPDSTGFSAVINLRLPDEAALEELGLEVGERYIIYTDDYYDSDWWLRSYFAKNVAELRGIMPKSLKDENLTVLTAEESSSRGGGDYDSPTALIATYDFGPVIHSFNRILYSYYHSTIINIADGANLPLVSYELDGEEKLVEIPLTEYTYIGNDGQTATMTAQELSETYSIPTIAKLEGGVEEFLADEENALWRQALDNIAVNSHAFPVIGVESLNHISNFCRGLTDIAEGRDFTAEELESGAKVCLISQRVADRNLLDVGDTISLQLYNSDPGLPGQIDIAEGGGTVNPMAGLYFGATTELTGAEEYTIIGIYDQAADRENVDNNLYSFTPNTIFAPLSSMDADILDYGWNGNFRSVIIQPGQMEVFRAAVSGAGFYGAFFCDDNGYDSVADIMATYAENAESAMTAGLALYGVILVIVLLMFPGSQRKTAIVMDSLGAGRGARIWHVWLSGLVILLPATALGTGCGTYLWQYVVDFLTTDGGEALNITMDINILGNIALLQLALAAALTLIPAGLMSTRRGMKK